MIPLLVLLAGLTVSARADVIPMNETPEQAEARIESKRQWREQLKKEAEARKTADDQAEAARVAQQAAEIEASNAQEAKRKAEANRQVMLETGLALSVLGVAAAWGLRRRASSAPAA